MEQPKRFQDENLLLSDFYNDVWVVCPACAKMAICKTFEDIKKARLFCINCGHNKEFSTSLGKNGSISGAAHQFFRAELWLKAPFKNDLFYAFNDKHLDYLERYIGANLRENKARQHFTLLEKLPKFYHEAKNREALLKIISKLKNNY
jgi:hypothetical protein